MSKTNYTERIAKGSMWVFFIGIFAAAIGFVLRIFLARTMSLEEFGLFYAVLAFLAFFYSFKDVGIGSALAKYIPEFYVKKRLYEIKFSIIFSVVFQYITGFFVFAFLFFFSEQISISFFHTIEAKPVIQILAVEFLISIVMLRQIIQGFQKMKTFASLELVRISAIFAFILACFLFFPPVTITKVAVSYLFSAVIVLLLFGSYVLKFSKEMLRVKAGWDWKIAKKLLRFGSFILFGGIAGTLIAYTDTLVLAFFRTVEEVGLYQVAVPTSQLLLVFISAMSAVLLPLFSEAWTKKEENFMSNAVNIIIKFSFVFMIPFVLIIVSSPELIINTLFGGKYLGASLALQILSIFTIAYTIMVVCSTLINSIGKPEINTKVMVTIAVLNLVLNVALVPIYGIVGASIATSLSFVAGFLILSGYVKKYIRLHIDWFSISKSLALGAVTLCIVFVLKALLFIENPILEAVICLAVAITFYGIAILRTGTIRKSDILIFRKMNFRAPKLVKKIVMSFAVD